MNLFVTIFVESYISVEQVKKKDALDVKLEEARLREIRSELCSGQIAGTFLASLQNKQVLL